MNYGFLIYQLKCTEIADYVNDVKTIIAIALIQASERLAQSWSILMTSSSHPDFLSLRQ